MVLFLLYIQAELENVASLSLDKKSRFSISVRNPLSDFETRSNVVIDPSVLLEPEEENSKEAACHFRLKWEGSKKFSVLTVLDDAQVKTSLKKKKKVEAPREYTADDSGNFVPILAVECRGLEPFEFHSMGGDFVVYSEGGAQFSGEDVDLSEGDWADYDADNDQPVSISSVSFKWEAL